jgi:hypothetical protein
MLTFILSIGTMDAFNESSTNPQVQKSQKCLLLVILLLKNYQLVQDLFSTFMILHLLEKKL